MAEAARTIGERSILLPVRQELPADPDDAFRIVRANLELASRNPRVLLDCTSMEWRRKDRPVIHDLHRRLDDCGPGGE